MRRSNLTLAAFFLFATGLAAFAQAENGVVILNAPGHGDGTTCVTLDQNRNIIAAGSDKVPFFAEHIMVMSLLPSGDLNQGFGTKGYTVTSVSNNFGDKVQACVIQPDGKILVGGFADSAKGSDLCLSRYSAKGVLDKTFGKSGIVIMDLGSSEKLYDIALQSDGKILATGYGTEANGRQNTLTARFTSAGKLDTTFGAGGIVKTSFPGIGSSNGKKVLVDTDSIVVVSHGVSLPWSACVARYDTRGNLVPSFGTNGMTSFIIPGHQNTSVTCAALDIDGTILVGGSSCRMDGSYEFTVVRLNSDGSYDTTFGGGTGVSTPLSDAGLDSGANALAIQSDGKIVASGWTGWRDTVLTVRLNEDGSLDTSFAGAGWIHFYFNTWTEGTGVVIQPDDKILVTGYTNDGNGPNSNQAIFMRFKPDGSLDPDF